MKAKKDPKTGKWMIQYRYSDWQGVSKKSTKRGFETKKEAEEWFRDFMATQQADFNMNFAQFVEIYFRDITPRIRKSTLISKRYMIEKKVLPYFKKKRVADIKPTDIRKWQNTLISKGYSQTYLRTINNQLTAIFNFAVRYYDLRSNPCHKAGPMGKSKADEMNFWTKDEFAKFIVAVKDKERSYIGFMILFWTGLRIGELLALTVQDIDFEKKTLTVSKSFQRIKGEDVITPPKTPKSNRVISIPEFLLEPLHGYIEKIYQAAPNDRLFPVTKYYFEHEMQRGVELSGVKKIRIHERHSHCALLFEMGVSALEAAERLGHEKVETTLNIYAHLYPNKQQQISDKLDQLFGEEFECTNKK